MVLARLRALTQQDMITRQVILSCRNGTSPFKGIDTPVPSSACRTVFLVEMVLARLRALTHYSDPSWTILLPVEY